MGGLLDEKMGVGIQFKIWGYAYTGNILETSAIIAEGSSEIVGGPGAWDKGAIDILSTMVAHGDEDYRPVKDFSALPWLVEHCIRRHEEWPGL